MHPNYEAIYRIVRSIPRGRVATYGQGPRTAPVPSAGSPSPTLPPRGEVARLAGTPRHARQVDYALHRLPEGSTVAWHRVVNARGEISRREEPWGQREQMMRLQMEGVQFKDGRIDLKRFGFE